MQRKKNLTQISIAGEYYVLAELARRDAVASMTIHNTKGVDILVSPLYREESFKVEVKTTTMKPGRAKLFHKRNLCYAWQMGEKHENIRDKNLIYVFVYLPDIGPPKFFLAESAKVADYVKRQHRKWLKVKGHRDNPKRTFRIPFDVKKRYEDNWELLGLPWKT